MFSKGDKHSGKGKAAADQVKPSAPSIISADLRIVGDLHSKGEIQVDDTIEGDIHSKILLVGETARIKGETIAESVRVHGTVDGQIKANTVILSKTAHVSGDVLHEKLAIEQGAFLEGHCRRIDRQSEPSGTVNLLVKDKAAGSPGVSSTDDARTSSQGKGEAAKKTASSS